MNIFHIINSNGGFCFSERFAFSFKALNQTHFQWVVLQSEPLAINLHQLTFSLRRLSMDPSVMWKLHWDRATGAKFLPAGSA